MDPVIYALSDLKLSEDEVVKNGFDEKLVRFVKNRIDSMRYKRIVPIVAKIQGDFK